MKKTTFLLAGMMAGAAAFAQKTDTVGIRNLLTVHFLNPGAGYEWRTGQFQSVAVQANLAVGVFTASNTSFGESSELNLSPTVSAQYRFYYNYNARSKKGLRTERNNLNYVAPAYQFMYDRNPDAGSALILSRSRVSHTVGAVWGFQRNYPKRFHLDLNLGLGISLAKEQPFYSFQPEERWLTQLGGIGNFTLGFWLGKR